MGHSSRLPLRAVKNVFHLLGEITDLAIDPHQWREHMLRRLCAMTGARVGLTVDLQDALPGQIPRAVDPIDVGFANDVQRNSYITYRTTEQRGEDPSMLAIVAQHQRRRVVVMRREQLVDSATWYASPITSEARRLSDVDDLLSATALLPQPGWLIGFSLYRTWGEKPFTERDRKLVKLFFTELQKNLALYREQDEPPAASLPPHLRQTLRMLLQGLSAKEAARELDLSVHTVNSYAKELYQRVGVSSRGELMAYFLTRPGRRPIFLPSEFDAP